MRKPFVLAAAVLAAPTLSAQTTPSPFRLEETTIPQIQAAFRDGSLTSRSLVEQYIKRIDTYDKNGPALNAIVLVNSDALNTATISIAASGSRARLESGQAADDVPGRSSGCRSRDEFREKLRAAVLALMDSAQLDALIYPTWSNPPRLIGDLNTPGGDNSQLFAPSTGFPAITVPMGATHGTLPAGLQFFGGPGAKPR